MAVCSSSTAPERREDECVIVTTLLVYDVVSVVYPQIVNFAERAGITTCSLYVPGWMKTLSAVVEVVEKELMADWI